MVIIGISLKTGPKLNLTGRVRKIQCSGPVLIEISFVKELHDIPEHGTVIHVMSVDQVISVTEVTLVLSRKEYGSGQ